jgi:uncharacterized protein (TIGR03435 family)
MKLHRPFALVALLVVSGVADIRYSLKLEAEPQATRSSTTSAPAPQSLKQMEAAGVKMTFDVASVKPNRSRGLHKSGDPVASNVTLAAGAWDGRGTTYLSTGGLFSATNIVFSAYIAFAFDLTAYQATELAKQLPNWAKDRFDIQARAEGNPTRAQMQLMMQSLLEDRFKLAMHKEIKEGPEYALVLVKPGKTGPQLKEDLSGESCVGPLPPVQIPSSDADFPPACMGIIGMGARSPGGERDGARGVTLELLAGFLPALDVNYDRSLDRPVLDRTGLRGKYDFSIEWTPQLREVPPGNARADGAGPTLQEALKEQLGLKLKPITGPVTVFVLDHIEEPSPN